MFAPRLVIVPRGVTEGAENTLKVMLVLKSNVLLNNCDASRPSVVRKKCACHSHLRRVRDAWVMAQIANTTIGGCPLCSSQRFLQSEDNKDVI
jgi:hypothetical protein